MVGGTIPAAVGGLPGVCTITVNVTAPTPGNYANTLAAGALVTSSGANVAASTAVLSVSTATATNVPTLTQWAMIALMLLLAVTGFTAMRTRIA
jgi:hypothetical protein